MRGILFDDFRLVHHVEFFRGITASVDHDGFLATRMISEEVCAIKNLTVDDNPDVFFGVVLGDIGEGVFLEFLGRLGLGGFSSRSGLGRSTRRDRSSRRGLAVKGDGNVDASNRDGDGSTRDVAGDLSKTIGSRMARQLVHEIRRGTT